MSILCVGWSGGEWQKFGADGQLLIECDFVVYHLILELIPRSCLVAIIVNKRYVKYFFV